LAQAALVETQMGSHAEQTEATLFLLPPRRSEAAVVERTPRQPVVYQAALVAARTLPELVAQAQAGKEMLVAIVQPT
jgi:hypothetical protein